MLSEDDTRYGSENLIQMKTTFGPCPALISENGGENSFITS